MTKIGVMRAPARVPTRLSSFIGRKKEMGELRRLLAHTRLLTMLGPGGAGKTRLAMEFARAQDRRFADGVITIELVEVRDPALVPDAFARAAGIRLQAEDAIGTLVHRLISSDMLLVVDNCEHLTEAAATVVGRLLAACPRLVVLATSREPLGVTGEQIFVEGVHDHEPAGVTRKAMRARRRISRSSFHRSIDSASHREHAYHPCE